MKKNILLKYASVLFVVVMFFPSLIQAQKSAFVDIDFILNNVPEYKDAQNELNRLSAQWEKEITQKHEAVTNMIQKYQSESVLLPEDLKNKRQEEIQKKQKEVTDLQKKYFSPNGLLFQQRQKLIDPIQEKIYNAIQTVARNQNIDMVFDKTSSATLLYGNPKFDISDAVLDELAKVMQVATPGAAR